MGQKLLAHETPRLQVLIIINSSTMQPPCSWRSLGYRLVDSLSTLIETLRADSKDLYVLGIRLTPFLNRRGQPSVIEFRPLEISNPFAFNTHKMMVMRHIGIESRSVVNNIDFGDRPTFCKGVECPVHCIKRNGGEFLSHGLEHVLCRRMDFGISYLQPYLYALRRHFDAVRFACLPERLYFRFPRLTMIVRHDCSLRSGRPRASHM